MISTVERPREAGEAVVLRVTVRWERRICSPLTPSSFPSSAHSNTSGSSYVHDMSVVHERVARQIQSQSKTSQLQTGILVVSACAWSSGECKSLRVIRSNGSVSLFLLQTMQGLLFQCPKSCLSTPTPHWVYTLLTAKRWIFPRQRTLSVRGREEGVATRLSSSPEFCSTSNSDSG